MENSNIYKPNVFIGSSGNSLDDAKIIKSELCSCLDVTVWEDFFKASEITYSALSTKSKLFDFAILVGNEEDLTIIRGEKVKQIRDNVIFELGLFIGVLGDKRIFLFCRDNPTLPTDLSGLTIVKYKDEKTLKESCEIIKQQILVEYNACRVENSMGTSFAFTYYTNFVKPLVLAVKDNYIKNQQENITIKILMPSDASTNISFDYYESNDCKEIEFKHEPRSIKTRSFYADDKEILCDIPTILASLYSCIEFLYNDGQLGVSDFEIKMRKKELFNFKKTIIKLFEKDGFSNLEIDNYDK